MPENVLPEGEDLKGGENQSPEATAPMGQPDPHPATMLVRQLLEQSVKYTQFMEHALNVNETDFKAMGALMQNGPMTAGQLAKAVGVSPGAATTVIDRLVAVGHVTRDVNPQDRRGIVVVPNPASVASAWGHLMPIIGNSEASIRSMSPEGQKAVVQYLEAMILAFVESGRSDQS
jgi:DNA-binding Lrp family transcriptional regulator